MINVNNLVLVETLDFTWRPYTNKWMEVIARRLLDFSTAVCYKARSSPLW